MSTNGCANLHQQKHCDWTSFCWFERPWKVSFWQHFSNFWWKISKSNLDGISMRNGCRGAEEPGPARGGDYIPLADFFESDLLRHAAVLRTVAADWLLQRYCAPKGHGPSGPLAFSISGVWRDTFILKLGVVACFCFRKIIIFMTCKSSHHMFSDLVLALCAAHGMCDLGHYGIQNFITREIPCAYIMQTST